MRVAIIIDPNNTFVGSLKRFKKDGKEFNTHGEKLALEYTSRGHEVEIYRLPKGKAHIKRKALYEAFTTQICGHFDRIFFFMHGSPKHLNRKMIKSDDIETLGNYIFARTTQSSKICLFSCLTGALVTPKGFAYQLCSLSMRTVMSHVKRGHTTQNWSKRIFMAHGRIRDCYPDSVERRREIVKHLENPSNLYIWIEFGFQRFK